MPKVTERSATYAPGEVILGKYRLEEVLGTGGMGEVWAAHNLDLDSPVAIKLIRSDVNGGALSQRLQQEARAAARLGHPAIVRVFDIGQTDRGDPFIVMELLEGESLAAALQRAGRLSAVEAVQLLLPIADALREAHAKGIVHRDIKPDNVFLAVTADGVQPKLVDFGIAKLDQARGSSQLTQFGTVMGSPDYMSPEQARGEDSLDYRTDIWSFTVVLYEAVTGRLPFDADNYNALLRMIVEDTPPTLVELRAGDAKLSSLVEIGLAKERDTRWRSMNDLGAALASWLILHGVVEDVVGTSVDAKWIHRRSDPAGRTSRSSLSSIPDALFSPASGVAVTMPGPPLKSPLPQKSQMSGRPGPVLSGRLVLAVLSGVLLLAALGYLALRPTEAQAPTSAETVPTLPPAPASAEPVATPEPVEPPPPRVDPVDREPRELAAEAPAPVASPSTTPVRRRPPPKAEKPGAPAPQKPAAGEDLMKPY